MTEVKRHPEPARLRQSGGRSEGSLKRFFTAFRMTGERHPRGGGDLERKNRPEKIENDWHQTTFVWRIREMRLSLKEKEALKKTFHGFDGEVYLFGSRLNDELKGGDIDVLIKPNFSLETDDAYGLKSALSAAFQMLLDQSIDIVIYKSDDPFSQEVMQDAQKITPEQL